MECERRQPPPSSPPAAAAAAAVMSLVLGDDDLLSEILLCLAFPTTLVRAALACKRWLRVASDPAFLRRFRARHPPQLLGFYAVRKFGNAPDFWPVCHPPDLASAARRAASAFGAFPHRKVLILDSRDGRLLTSFFDGRSHGDAVLSPLYPGRYETIHRPVGIELDPGVTYCSSMLLPENARDGVLCLESVCSFREGERQTTFKANMFKDGLWGLHTSVRTELLEELSMSSVLISNKLYMKILKNIIVLDLASSSFSVLDFPEEKHGGWLSKAEDSGIYVINVIGFQELRVWLHRTVSGRVGSWLLVDTICLPTIFADLGMPVGAFDLCCVGDNAEFVLLNTCGSVFYFNIRSRTVEKLFDVVPGDLRCYLPFTMVWPPSFSTVKEGHDLDE